MEAIAEKKQKQHYDAEVKAVQKDLREKGRSSEYHEGAMKYLKTSVGAVFGETKIEKCLLEKMD